MLGSFSDADDAVQEVWLRLTRPDHEAIDNLRAWLTTVLSRTCLNMLRAGNSRREHSVPPRMPDPIVSGADEVDPEQAVVLIDSVGLALMVVLHMLAPAEQVAVVLHDSFAVPYQEIARAIGRSPAATRQLASRARRRVQRSPDRR